MYNYYQMIPGGESMEARLTKIPEREVLRYLSIHGEADAALRASIAELGDRLLQAARPRLVWRRLPVAARFVEGEDLRRLLADAEELVLFAATLGMEVERLSRQLQLTDMAGALILDACADAAIENVCDNFCGDLASEISPLCLTRRFSPGYGDLPLTYQKKVFEALDVFRRIGISLTESGLMLPQKSVTAVMGIRRTPLPHTNSPCEGCNLYNHCTHRREAAICEKRALYS